MGARRSSTLPLQSSSTPLQTSGTGWQEPVVGPTPGAGMSTARSAVASGPASTAASVEASGVAIMSIGSSTRSPSADSPVRPHAPSTRADDHSRVAAAHRAMRRWRNLILQWHRLSTALLHRGLRSLHFRTAFSVLCLVSLLFARATRAQPAGVPDGGPVPPAPVPPTPAPPSTGGYTHPSTSCSRPAPVLPPPPLPTP